MEEPVTAWRLVKLWDMESDGISLTAVDAEYEQQNYPSLKEKAAQPEV